MQVAQEELGAALGWARERGLAVEDELSYLHEFEHITLARVLLARYAAEPAERSIQEVTRLLERLLRAAEAGQRTGSVIEILVVQALAHQAREDVPAARASLQRAVTLAEPEGYVRIFADEGPPMASLLRAVSKQGTAPDYVRRLLAAVSQTGGSTPASQELIEPLSARELDVLRLLGTDLDGPDIAREPRRVAEHRADAHQEHLRQARREQPPGRGPPGSGTRPAANRRPPIPARGRSRPVGPGPQASPVQRLASPASSMGPHRTRFTGRMAAAPMMAQTPATPYSTP